MKPSDIYVLSLSAQASSPDPKQRVYLRSPPSYKPSQCTPLFLAAFTKRNAGCCIHTHSHWAVLVTLLLEKERSEKPGEEERGKVFEINNIEQIKGFGRGFGKQGNLGYHDTLRIPVIENTAHEEDLTEFLEEAMDKYPDTYAVLVRRHGVYVWGENVHKAKTMCERYVFFSYEGGFGAVVVVVVRIGSGISGGISGGELEERGLTFFCLQQLGLPLPTRRRDEAARSSLDYRYRAYHSHEEVSSSSSNNKSNKIVIPERKPKTLDKTIMFRKVHILSPIHTYQESKDVKHSIKTLHAQLHFGSLKRSSVVSKRSDSKTAGNYYHNFQLFSIPKKVSKKSKRPNRPPQQNH